MSDPCAVTRRLFIQPASWLLLTAPVMRMESSHLATLHLLCVPFLPSLYRPRRVMPETTNNTCFCLLVLPTLFSRLARMEPRAFAGKPSAKQVNTQWQARGKNQWVEAHTASCHIGRPSSAAASATPSGCAGGNNNSAHLRTTPAAPPPCALPCCTWHGFAATAAATGMPVQIRCPSLQQLRRHVCRLAGRGVGCAGRQQRLALRHVLDDVVLYKGWGGWVGGWVAGLVAWWDEEWVAAAEPCLDMTGRMGGCRPKPQRSNAGVEPAAATSGGGGPALHTCTSAFCTYTAAGARGNRAGGSQ